MNRIVFTSGMLIALAVSAGCRSSTSPSEPRAVGGSGGKADRTLVVHSKDGELMVNSQGAPVPEGFPFTVMPGAVVTTSFNRGKAPDEKSLMVLFEKHGLQEPVIEYYTKELRSKGFDVEEHYEIGDDTYAVLSLTGTREDGFRAGVVVKANLRVQATGVTARITYKGPNATEVN